jgi:hypothetical protein
LAPNAVRFGAAGQALTAAALNNNFDELYALTAKPAITRSGKSISVGGVYCGTSATAIDVATVGGYTGVKSICETTCASATAHVCDPSEVLRSNQLSLAPPAAKQVWVNGYFTDGTDNCAGWTDRTHRGLNWGLAPVGGLDCATSFPIACCGTASKTAIGPRRAGV